MLARQAKQNYDEEVACLRKELVVLENEMGQQVKDFKTEREHCYELLNKLEGEVMNLQNQKDGTVQVLEAREQQIMQLLRDQNVTQFRIKEIADYTTRKC